jgi:hypothetical protein
MAKRIWWFRNNHLGIKDPSNIFQQSTTNFRIPICLVKINKIIKFNLIWSLQRELQVMVSCHLISVKPIAIAQRANRFMAESSVLLPIKKIIQNYAFKMQLIHAWGPVMTISMGKANVDMDKVLCCRKGICLNFTTRIPQILRKSMRLSPFLIAWIPSCYYFKFV